jgi:hypothetical protein
MSTALLTYLASLIKGESSQYNRLFGGALPDKATAVTADLLYHNGPCLLYGYSITVAMSAHPLELRDSLTAGGGTVKAIVPASAPVGVTIWAAPIPLDTGLFVDFNAAGTGTILPIILRAAL